MNVASVAEVRRIEAETAKSGTSMETLMRTAGEAVAAVVTEMRAEGPVLLLVGPGNNGGDGLTCAARLQAQGREVALYTYRRESVDFGGLQTVRAEDDQSRERLEQLCRSSAVVVDALFGTGQVRAPDESLQSLLATVNGSRVTNTLSVAVDLPTGVEADTGAVWNTAFRADVTVALGLLKRAMVLHPGADFCGEIQLVDIGLAPVPLSKPEITVPTAADIAHRLPNRALDSNKGSGGRLLVVGGSRQYVGAPMLVAVAAYRIGAGLVEVAVPESIQLAVATHALEPIYLSLPDAHGGVAAGAIDALRSSIERAKAVVLGPGLGMSNETLALVSTLLLHTDELQGVPVVVDADALNALARIDHWWTTRARLVLTPHPGEMGRLTGLETAQVQKDRLNIALRHAQKWDHIVVLKGAYTVVASSGDEASVNPTGGPNLATAGTGDVLSGTIGGLLAQGCTPLDAAICGTYLHGLAGDLLRTRHGDTGTLASDLHTALPLARQSVLNTEENSQ